MEGNRKERRNYSPADYRALQDEAAEKSKEDLEKFYIKTKDEKYTSPCVQILCFIMILLFIGVTIYGIYLTAEDDIESDISKIVKEVSYDICPMLGNNYVSIEFFESEYQINKIDCHNFCIDNC